jgi:hypothetical protein
MRMKKNLSCLAILALLAPVAANAASPKMVEGMPAAPASPETARQENRNASPIQTERLSDWLEAQGNDVNFFPPIGDYAGWASLPPRGTDLFCTTFALVDYAGVADRYLQESSNISLGTQVTGNVIERRRPDGTAVVTIDTWTTNALGFAQDCAQLDAVGTFADTPTIFGNKAVDVALFDATPALGPVKLRASFVIQNPGGPLPDLIAVVFNACDFVPVNFSFDSLTYGTRPDGTQAVLRVLQTGALNKQQCDRGEKEPVFGVERVEIKDLPRGRNPQGPLE